MTGVDVVIARHLAQSEVTALIGSRVTAMMLPPKVTLPAVRVRQISRVEPMHERGMVGYAVERIQCDYVATTLDAARQVRDAAREGIAGWAGSIGSPGTVVDCIEPVNGIEWFDAEERQTPVVTQDYFVQYRP